MKLKNIIDRSINWGAGLPATPWQLAAVFAATVMLRNLMEAVSLGIVFPAPAFLLHFPVAYVFPLLTLVFFMKIFSGYDAAKLLKIMVLAWTLTLLPPLIDKLAGTTSAIGYFPLERSNAAWFLLNFFNPAAALTGTTPGIRIEAAIGCILAGVFTWAVAPNKRALRGILNAIVFGPVFLSFFTWPYLICVIFQPLFPGDGNTHSLLQWHAATGAPTSGASHYITYLVDMIPVSLLALWFVRELSGKKWKELKRSFRKLIPLYSAAVLGTVAAFAIVPSSGITFADTVTIAGTMIAAFWLITASAWKGSFRGVASVAGLSLAWAAGWETLVLAGLALTAGAFPGPDKWKRSFFAVALFVMTLSPVGFTLAAPAAVICIVVLPLLVIFSERKLSRLILIAIPLAAILVSPPASRQNAWLRGVERRTDTFARSSRVALALESASRLTAGGGSWLTLGETTHMTGQDMRSRYVCETAMARGNSSSSLMKVMMNLAFERTDSTAFNTLYRQYMNTANEDELNEAITMRVTFLALTGDTTSLNYIHSRAGLNPMLLRSMATAYMAQGDSSRSLQYSLAFLDSPAASPVDWARTITLAAVTGQADWDSIYLQAENRLGYCLPTMLSRLRASVIADNTADRRDLLERCLLVKPDGIEVLETAAMWYSAAGIPDTTLIYASRAIASQTSPSMTAFSLALNAALESGNFTEAAITARYGALCYPSVVGHRAVLAGILKAQGDTLEVPLLEQSFSRYTWAQSLCDSLALVVCAAENL